jgi:hypothetical protein
MEDNDQNDYSKMIYDLLTNRINHSRTQKRVPGPDGDHIIDDLIDETYLDENRHPKNITIGYDHLLDCHHPARDNLGGRCHYCDKLICKKCAAQCSSCGLVLCQSHATEANFGDGQKTYCRECAEEIARSIKIRSFWKWLLSFLFGSEKDNKE